MSQISPVHFTPPVPLRSILACFPYFEKVKGGGAYEIPCNLSAYSYIYISPLIFKAFEAYEVNFLSVSLFVPLNIFVLYAVRVVSKESRLLVLPKTSCISNKIMHLPILHIHEIDGI
jgi:hypothetical protein